MKPDIWRVCRRPDHYLRHRSVMQEQTATQKDPLVNDYLEVLEAAE